MKGPERGKAGYPAAGRHGAPGPWSTERSQRQTGTGYPDGRAAPHHRREQWDGLNQAHAGGADYWEGLDSETLDCREIVCYGEETKKGPERTREVDPSVEGRRSPSPEATEDLRRSATVSAGDAVEGRKGIRGSKRNSNVNTNTNLPEDRQLSSRRPLK
jgi:hypothetical protein